MSHGETKEEDIQTVSWAELKATTTVVRIVANWIGKTQGSAEFRQRVRNDGEDHRHEARLRPCRGRRCAFDFPEFASRDHSGCGPGGSTRYKKRAAVSNEIR